MCRVSLLRGVLVLVGVSACGPAIADEPELASDDAHAQAEDDPIADVFAACLDAHGEPTQDACEARDAGACLRSPVIAGGNVCTFIGCHDDDDCAELQVDDARVECRNDVLADADTCVLACDELRDCPAGMVCGAGVCLWVPER